MMLDKDKFPRDKACAGWVTPGALQELALDAAEYANGRVLQPIFGFRTCYIGGPVVETRYDHAVGYGIRRIEFDQYLVERSGVWLQDGEELTSLERASDAWVINKGLRASVLVGAGGHSCPVAQHLGAKPSSEPALVAREMEYRVDGPALDECAVEPGIAEIYYCTDLKGYGWCLRKKNYISIGLGRTDRTLFNAHMTTFLQHLKKHNKLPGDVPDTLQGQNYLLYGMGRRLPVADRALLLGDSAGLANPRSGEGIRPAIESGLLAGRTIQEAQGDYSRQKLEPYRARLISRFGPGKDGRMDRISKSLPDRLRIFLARRLLASIRFSRDILLNRWLLRADELPLMY